MSDFIYKSAKQLAQYIQSKQASSSEIVLAHLKQIEKINPVLNAINQVDNERILQAAAEADRLLSNGKLIGPLHGVPISVKDNILTEGIITTSGCKAFSSNIPDRDATVIKRLKAAGAIVLGKTNMPDFAMCWDTDSSAYGKTNNPYDLTKTVGGSSGGEASIIAAGGSPLGIANDGGGSIRLPSHYCGIAGFRPSIGLVPTTGLFPATESGFASGAAGKILSVSPMARFVEDLIYTLPILAGSDNCDPNALGYPLLASSEQGQLKNLRVAYYQHANDATNSSVFKTIHHPVCLTHGKCSEVYCVQMQQKA
jgi:amidase